MCVTRLRLLVTVHFASSHRHHLYGQTDHSSSRWLRSFKELEGQLARWPEVLDTYTFTKQRSEAEAKDAERVMEEAVQLVQTRV